MTSTTALYDKVVEYVRKPINSRSTEGIEEIFPWFIQKSKFFASLKPDVVKDIIRNCEFSEREADDVIIRQFDTGDCFYIILSGKVSIYINTEAVQDEVEQSQEGEQSQESKPTIQVSKKATNRTKFGNHVGSLDGGASFGELALINRDCIRNASIIADVVTHLIVVNRATYNRSLREVHLAEFRARNEFVQTCPIFAGWIRSLTRQAAMSLVKVTYGFDTRIIQQGDKLNGLLFLLKGNVQTTVDILMHSTQYPGLTPKSRPSGQIKDPSKPSDVQFLPLSVLEDTENMKGQLGRKPLTRLGYNIGERLNQLRHMDLSVAGPGIIFGELERGLGISTYCFSATCAEDCEFYLLDAKNFERLITSRRNPNGLRQLRVRAEANIFCRRARILDRRIPLFLYFYEQIIERKRKELEEQRERFLASKQDNRKRSKGYDDFIPERGPLIDEYGPGTVFYRNRQRRRAQKRKEQIQKKKPMIYGFRSPTPYRARSQASTKREDEENSASPRRTPRIVSRSIAESARWGTGKMSDRSESARWRVDECENDGYDMSDWETTSTYLNTLESKLAKWYTSLEMSTGEYFFSSGLVSPLKRFHEPVGYRRLLPGKTVYLRPMTVRLSLATEEIEMDATGEKHPGTAKTSSTRTVRFENVDELLKQDDPYASTSQILFSDEDRTIGYEPQLAEWFTADEFNEEPGEKTHSEGEHEAAEDSCRLSLLNDQVRQVLDNVRPITCRTGYDSLLTSSQKSPELAQTTGRSPFTGRRGTVRTARTRASRQSIGLRRRPYTATEYQELKKVLREAEVKQRHFRALIKL